MSKGRQESTSNDSSNSPAAPKAARPVRKTAPKKPKVVSSASAAESTKPVAESQQSKKIAPQAVNSITEANLQSETHIDNAPITKTDNMEVHHHPQLEHKPKPFKEYLLEGFMIFVAVMMGFIAENIREAIDNREHVEQLTTQLVQDLKSDAEQLNEVFRGETQVSLYNDSLFTLAQQPLQKADLKKIQIMVMRSHTMWPFHPSTGAMAAIKNELHLKQFSNSKLLSYFARFEKHNELLQTAQNINLQYQRTYLDPFITLHFTPKNMALAFEAHTVQNGQMRNLTQNDLDQLAANIVLMRVITHEILRDHRMLKNDVEETLKYVTRQYDLEEK